jgi:formylglycine-generating enzyme required for sulfatase activity
MTRTKKNRPRTGIVACIILLLTALPMAAAGAEDVPEGMVLVPAGEFMMGSPSRIGDTDERPQRKVSVDAFYMDRHEVTNAEYKAFVDAAGYSGEKDADENYLKHWENGTYPSDHGNYPVVRVSYENAQAFARWAGKRLPTEEEWEYACRAGTTTQYSFGDSVSHDDANYYGTEGKDKWETAGPVGSFAPNAWGLFDMHGNVWEWCTTWYDPNRVYRIIRGGSWYGDPGNIRSSFRSYYPPAHTGGDLGFRCVKDKK